MIFGRTEAGKIMPIDAEQYVMAGGRVAHRLVEYPDGNVVVTSWMPGGAPYVRVLKKAELAQDPLFEQPRHKAHFATCPTRKRMDEGKPGSP